MLNTQLARTRDTEGELYDVDKAFDQYKKLYPQQQQQLPPHPDLSPPAIDYTPSAEQKKYENMFIGGGTAVAVAGSLALA